MGIEKLLHIDRHIKLGISQALLRVDHIRLAGFVITFLTYIYTATYSTVQHC